jgi:AcrR family transcriptional regulator
MEAGAAKTTTTRRRGGREARHSTADVLQAALELIDADGLQEFSMRRLAERMSVGPMTVYGYVRSKEELLDGVVGLALHGVLDDLDSEAPWDEQIAVATRDLHDALRSHPGVLELLLSKPAPSPQLDLIRETLLGVMRRAGFDDVGAWEAVGMLASYAIGFAVSQASYAGLGSSEHVERLRALPTDAFPNLAKGAGEYPQHMSNRAFERGLAHLISGLRRDLDPG